jgi:hypothetical protein
MGTRQYAVKALDLTTVRATVARPANATQYTADDAISAITTDEYHTFSKPTHENSRMGAIVGGRITSSVVPTALTLDAELWLFRSAIAETVDNAAWAPTDAEMLTRVGVIDFPVASWKVNSANAGCEAFHGGSTKFEVPFVLATDGMGSRPTLHGQLIPKNAYTPQSGEIFTIDLVIARY